MEMLWIEVKTDSGRIQLEIICLQFESAPALQMTEVHFQREGFKTFYSDF